VVQAGIPLVDDVGKLLMTKIREGDQVRVEADRVFVGDDLVAVGVRQSAASVAAAMDAAQQRLAEQFESFASNTLEFMARERDLLFGGLGLPDLEHDMSGRHVLVVVRSYSFKEDLGALRPYIREVKPILIGVDGGADALIEEGYEAHIILGDMDSVSEGALRSGAEILLHAYPNGFAPGKERLVALGLQYATFKVSGTSEDAAFLLAHGKGADLIVAVGTHGNLREFLDKGRMGMASTFLVRLRVGETLVDAKGVSRLYRRAVRWRETWVLVLAALVLIVVVVAVSPPLRLEVKLLWENFRQFLFDLTHGQ
jgi:uncharacterized membrane-anchored protein